MKSKSSNFVQGLPGASGVIVHAGPGEVGLPFGVWFVSWFAFYCRLLIHAGAYHALVQSAGYSIVLGLLVKWVIVYLDVIEKANRNYCLTLYKVV